MKNKRELIKDAQELGIDTTDLTKSELQAAIIAKTGQVEDPPENTPFEPPPDTKIIAPKKKKKAKSEYPKHLPHEIMQPGPTGLSTGG